VIGADCNTTLNKVSKIYKDIIKAGIHKVSSIKVAEASKAIENAQRDINIAFVNEVMMLSKALDINSYEVLEAAKTKWNFLNFKPGLVGGHCIGVDPYYLTYKSKQIGYYPDLISSSRRLNNGMGIWISEQVIVEIVKRSLIKKELKILMLGISFKENCPDIRNTKVLDIIKMLEEYNVEIDIVDPWVDKASVKKKYNLKISENLINGKKYSAVITSVAHKQFLSMSLNEWKDLIKENGILYDLKGLIPRELDTLRI